MNDHLGSLHLLHHKQQILNIQMLATQVLQQLEGKNCEEVIDHIELLQKDISDNLEAPDLSNIIQVFREFIQKDLAGSPCDTLYAELETYVRSYLNLINREQNSFQDHVKFTDLSSIDTVKAYKNIIDPLSNQKRLDILVAIHHHKRRFKDLETELNLQAGHLIYHLNPLKEGGYVEQDDHKNYSLTSKGNDILDALKYIYDNHVIED